MIMEFRQGKTQQSRYTIENEMQCMHAILSGTRWYTGQEKEDTHSIWNSRNEKLYMAKEQWKNLANKIG